MMIPGILAQRRRGPVLWTPADLSVAAKIWLDDASAVLDVSGVASQWNDRSGNGWHFSQGTAVKRPQILADELNGKRVLRFDGVNDVLSGDASTKALFRDTAQAWALAVFERASTGTATEVIFGASYGTLVAASRFRMDIAGNVLRFAANRVDGASADLLSGSTFMSAGSRHIVLMSIDYASSRSGSIYLDGSLEANKSWSFSAGNTSDSDSLGVSIGANMNQTEAFLGGSVAAIVAGRNIPSSEEVDKLFGWAAWRYGLVDNLPIGHTYKSAPPLA